MCHAKNSLGIYANSVAQDHLTHPCSLDLKAFLFYCFVKYDLIDLISRQRSTRVRLHIVIDTTLKALLCVIRHIYLNVSCSPDSGIISVCTCYYGYNMYFSVPLSSHKMLALWAREVSLVYTCFTVTCPFAPSNTFLLLFLLLWFAT